MNVQAVINNIGFPSDIEGLRYFVEEEGKCNVKGILEYSMVEWTMPRWAVKDDIVFFYHAVTAKDKIRSLEKQIELNRDDLYDAEDLMCGLEDAKKLYDLYGGKIFAIGRVLDEAFRDDGEWQESAHWSNKIYAIIGGIHVLENPIASGTFSNFIKISRHGAITPVMGESFSKLKKLIASQNVIPGYLKASNATPMPLSKINEKNWLAETREYKRLFFLEAQFRQFYVNFLLKKIGDRKTIYSECACYKKENLLGYVDNGIYLEHKICFVEVKLNFDIEKDFIKQLKKYCYIDRTKLKKDKEEYKTSIVQDFVIVIDKEKIGVFDARSEQIDIICELDILTSESDLEQLKKKLKETIFDH